MTDSVTGVSPSSDCTNGTITRTHGSVASFGRISFRSSTNAIRGSPTYGVSSSRAHVFEPAMFSHLYHQSKIVSCTCSPCDAAREMKSARRDVYFCDGCGKPKRSVWTITRTVFACSEEARARSSSMRSGRQSVHISVQPASARK